MTEIKRITYEDWFINQEYEPKEGIDDEDVVNTFWDYHKDLCINGFWMYGVYFPGYLYWHLNFWKTEVDDGVDVHGKGTQSYMNPTFRDNEWIIFNSIYLGESKGKGVNIFGSRRISKDLLNTSKLYTPKGEIEIGDAIVGERIYDDLGELTTIVGVYPQGVRPVYKMTLEDSREIFCGIDHNWSVIYNDKEVVKTTRELIDGGVDDFYIRRNRPINYPHNPYLDYSEIGFDNLDIFVRSSVAQRKNIVRALGLSNNGVVINSNKKVLENVAFLIRSLGGEAVIGSNKVTYNLYPKDKTKIVSIEYQFDDYTTCIEVDNEQKLFLTDGFTITHNTTTLASYFAHGGTFDRGSQNIIAGLDSYDITLLTDALDMGLNHIPERWKWQKFGSWDKQITLGVEDDQRKRYPFSRYMIRNLDGGNKQERIAGTKPRKLLIDEALWEEEKVLLNTENWIPIKDVSVGDFIFDHKGSLTKVLRKIDVGQRDLYEFTLNDGRKVISCPNHRWKVYDRVKKCYVETTTKEIVKTYKKGFSLLSKYRYSLPQIEPVQYSAKRYNIPPFDYGILAVSRILPIYLKGSVIQRLELLYGIVNKHNTGSKGIYPTISSEYRGYIRDVKQLLNSLGIPFVAKSDYKIVINFNEKKSNRIVNVEKKGVGQAYCIEVSNDDHIFLTTNYLPTLNCGKGHFLKGLAAATPGFTTATGLLSCSPLVFGTSGDVSVVEDAMKLFENPASMDFLEFPNEENPDKPTGLYMNAKYRLEAKDPWKFGTYLLEHKEDPLIKMVSKVDWDAFDIDKLNEVTILVSNEEKAFKITDEKVEQRRLAGDIELYLKEKMYYPKKREDLFLKSSTNFFNKEAITTRQNLIKSKNLKGVPVELFNDGEGIVWRKSDKRPVTEYPVKTESKDAPIVIYEFPEESPPWGLYVSGIDSYRQSGDSIYSTSLGAVVIYKRTKSISDGGMRNTVVATYAARPDEKSVWNEQARLLIKFYNAYTLVENDDYSFIDYMKQKGDASRYLAPQPAWLKEVTPYTTQTRDFGVSRSGKKTRDFLDGLVKDELDEVIHKEYDDEGNVIKEILGVTKMNDYMLLEEIKLYEDGVNADRYVAFQLALALARDLDNIEGKNRDEIDKESMRKSSQIKIKKSNRKVFGSPVRNSLLKRI